MGCPSCPLPPPPPPIHSPGGGQDHVSPHPPRCQRVRLSVVDYVLGPLSRPLGSRGTGLGSEELCMYTTLCTPPAVWRGRRQSLHLRGLSFHGALKQSLCSPEPPPPTPPPTQLTAAIGGGVAVHRFLVLM